MAEQLPDHQASWGADGSLNVLVKTDRAAAEKKIREVYDGPLCVKRGVGPTSTDAERAEKALVARMEGIKELNSIYTFATRDGLWLAVEVVALTPALEQQITQIVGPEVSPYLVWSPQIQPVV